MKLMILLTVIDIAGLLIVSTNLGFDIAWAIRGFQPWSCIPVSTGIVIFVACMVTHMLNELHDKHALQ